MKKTFVSLFILLVALNSCNTKDTGDPRIVVERFVDAVSKKDMAAVRSLSTADSKFVLDKMETSINKNEGGIMNLKIDKSKIEIGAANITGDNAIVPVKETGSGEAFDIPLKKENGEWKLSFDMSSMMTMGMKKMNEKGFNFSDSSGVNLNSLKNLNLDSLKNEMGKKGISLDSIRRELLKNGITLDSFNNKSIEINIP